LHDLQVIPNGLNRLNRKTIKYPRILLAKNTFTKKVQTVRKVQPSLYPDTLWTANRPRSSNCNASVNSCARGCQRSGREKRSSARAEWSRERRPAPPVHQRPLLEAT